MAKIINTFEKVPLDVNQLSADEQRWAYNGLDCCITLEVFEELKAKIPEAGFAYDMARAMQGPAFTLMARGIPVDLLQAKSLCVELYADRTRSKATFDRLALEGVGLEINYRSWQQLHTLFYERLGLPVVKAYNKLTKESQASVNRDALEKLATHTSAKFFVELILHMRDIDKKIQVLESGIDDDGRMRCSYNVVGTLSGRWSSRKSAFGRGTNLQSISDEMRRVFVPSHGKKFGQLDLAQAESKLVAYLSLPYGRNYRDACESGDLHTAVAKMVWPALPWGKDSFSDKEVANRLFYRHFSYRAMAKRGGHGSNYVGSANILSQHLKIPLEIARQFQDSYFARKGFSEIRRWQDSIRLLLASTRTVITPLGRKCAFPGRPWDSETVKSAVAYNPQSTVGDILNIGFYKIWKKYDKLWSDTNPIELLLQIHDAILFEYDEDFEDELIPLLKQEIVVPISINGEICRIQADAQVGWNWGKVIYDERGGVIENPYGLTDYKGRDSRTAPKRAIASVLAR